MASPPPKQAARKKRQSLLPSNNSTPAGSPLGPSTKQPAARFNDDAAEKANRRKSAHFSPAQAQAQAAVGTKVPIRNKRLSTVTRPVQEPQVSIEVMSNNFEEWMKLATDNVCMRGEDEELS
jgi:condensin complex subunit 2